MRVKNSELAIAGIDDSTSKHGFRVGIGVGYAFGHCDFGDTRLTPHGINYRW